MQLSHEWPSKQEWQPWTQSKHNSEDGSRNLPGMEEHESKQWWVDSSRIWGDSQDMQVKGEAAQSRQEESHSIKHSVEDAHYAQPLAQTSQ